MASRIQGITVEIGGDTTKLQTALKGLNGEIKSTQTALKEVLPHSLVIRWCSDTLILPQAIVYYSVHTWYA